MALPAGLLKLMFSSNHFYMLNCLYAYHLSLITYLLSLICKLLIHLYAYMLIRLYALLSQEKYSRVPQTKFEVLVPKKFLLKCTKVDISYLLREVINKKKIRKYVFRLNFRGEEGTVGQNHLPGCPIKSHKKSMNIMHLCKSISFK